MAGPARFTGKAAASISFGLGSFMLMADITLVVLTKGEDGGNLFEMGFPTIIGWSGLLLWVVGTVLLVVNRVKGRSTRKDSIKPIFLKGGKEPKCRKCGSKIPVTGVDFHRRYKCGCGAVYDLYQDEEEVS